MRLVSLITLSNFIISGTTKTRLSSYSLLGIPLRVKILVHHLELPLTLFDFYMALINESSIALIMAKSVHFII